MFRDRIAVPREKILVKTTPVLYPASRLTSLEPSGDLELQERRPEPPPEETLLREIKNNLQDCP